MNTFERVRLEAILRARHLIVASSVVQPIKFAVVISVFTLIACTSACNLNAESSERAARNAEAREFFENNCAQCHGLKGEGKQVEDKFVPSLRRGRVVGYTDEKIMNQIRYGGGGMLPFRFQLREEQIKNMVRYIRDMQKEDKQ
ncbi:MAG: hypothetical protein NVSMB56_18600 [Pyrinomonadaceae bacterium]